MNTGHARVWRCITSEEQMKSNLLLALLAGLALTGSNLVLADDTSTSGTDSSAATEGTSTDTGQSSDSSSDQK
jgi:hypothetical protein